MARVPQLGDTSFHRSTGRPADGAPRRLCLKVVLEPGCPGDTKTIKETTK